jgi:AcrR family transcriptional regulator
MTDDPTTAGTTAGATAAGATAAGGSAAGGSAAGDTAADSAPRLPPSLAAAWGLDQRPGKGPKRGLSLKQIVDAAVRVGDTEGLAAISMARVAAELGAGTMALYRYVGSKSELIALVVDAAFGPPPPLPESATYWRPALSHWAASQLAAMRSQMWAVPIPISGPPATPHQVAWLEQGLRCLRGTGLDESAKLSVILLISGYVRNQASLEAQFDAALSAAGTTDQQLMADYNRILGVLTRDQDFPEVRAVIASGVMGKADDWDDEFAFGLDRILDGIGVLVDSLR